MTYALDNFLVVAPAAPDDEGFEAWLKQLELISKLRPLEDAAAAFSKRALALNVSVVRLSLAAGQGATWPEVVSNAGGMVDPIERGLAAALAPGAAVWLNATAEQTVGASFAAHTFGGEQGISAIVFDLVPGAVRRFLQPLGRQALKRVCAAFEGAGVMPYFMARERCSGEALLALGVPAIFDVPALGRSVPKSGVVSEHELDLGAVIPAPQMRSPVSALCDRILELCDLRAHFPIRVTVKGTPEEIARSGAYLEDLALSRITLRLEATQTPARGIGLDTLRASPVLATAFGGEIEVGRDSDPDAMDYRTIRAPLLPELLIIELARRLVDQIGHGLKDISVGGQFVQLDVRP